MYKPPFTSKFTAYALLIELILGNISAYGGSASSKISIKAKVVRKASSKEYQELRDTINRKIHDFKKNGGGIQRKAFRVTVNLDCPYGSHGILIEETE
jgi:hypothetical protein